MLSWHSHYSQSVLPLPATFFLPLEFGHWVFWLLEKVSYRQPSVTVKEIRASYEEELGDFEELLYSEVWELLAENGLLLV